MKSITDMPAGKKRKSIQKHQLVFYLERWVLESDQEVFNKFKAECKIDSSIYTQANLIALGLHKRGLEQFNQHTVEELTLLAYLGNKYAAAQRVMKYYKSNISFKKSRSSYAGGKFNSSHINRKIKEIQEAIKTLDGAKPQDDNKFPCGWVESSLYSERNLDCEKVNNSEEYNKEVTPQSKCTDNLQVQKVGNASQGNDPYDWKLPDNFSFSSKFSDICDYCNSDEVLTTNWFRTNFPEDEEAMEGRLPKQKMSEADVSHLSRDGLKIAS